MLRYGTGVPSRQASGIRLPLARAPGNRIWPVKSRPGPTAGRAQPDGQGRTVTGAAGRGRLGQSGWAMSLAWSATAAPVTVARSGRISRQRRIAGAICGFGTRSETVQCGTHRPGR